MDIIHKGGSFGCALILLAIVAFVVYKALKAGGL